MTCILDKVYRSPLPLTFEKMQVEIVETVTAVNHRRGKEYVELHIQLLKRKETSPIYG
jgi:hypothetical protein